MASLKDDGTVPVVRELFIIWVTYGTISHIFKRFVGSASSSQDFDGEFEIISEVSSSRYSR